MGQFNYFKGAHPLKTITAGYHWFTDWGRDTMIALPGLTLATGRFDDAKKNIQAFAQSISQGMLPNRFPVGLRSLMPDDPHYSPVYSGNGSERDSAYHQGTVWAWLLGPWLTDLVRVNG
jgi:glycogen debranching enzyme